MSYKRIEEICLKYKADFLYDEPLAEYTSFKIGGSCDIIVKPNNVDCLREILLCCRKNDIKYYIFGKGSNVLVSDKGLKGVVILLSNDFSSIWQNTEDEELIYCSAGASLSKVCLFAKEKSLTGLEFAYGIPGSVGGALYMNAGAFGGEMSDVVESCFYLDESFELKEMKASEMELSYRHSVFCDKHYIIVSVSIRLKKGVLSEISDKMNELMERRREKQPLEYPSAGSTFKRPEGDFAARLIEASGLKGYTCGGAQVSEKHSGFVINKDNATFKDVLDVIDGVKKKVYEDSGVMLECEMLIIR